MRHELISRYLDTVGDGSGVKNGAVDHSGAAVEYKIAPPSGHVYQIARLIVSIEDNAAFDSGGYGGITPTAALTNGISVLKKDDDETMVDLTDGIPVKTNAGWATLCHDFIEHGFGSGNVIGTARWTFAQSGEPVTLDGRLHEYLCVVLNDDLSDLVAHRFLVQGVSLLVADND